MSVKRYIMYAGTAEQQAMVGAGVEVCLASDVEALEKRITEVEGELADYKRLELLQRDRAFRAEQLLQARTYEKENTEKRLAEVVKLLRRAKKQIRDCNCKDHSVHLCDDCESVVTGINLFIAEGNAALTHAHEEEGK